MRGLFCLLGLVTLAAPTVAQEPDRTFNLAGVVLDRDSDRPVAGAYIHVPELGRHIHADTLGRFTVAAIQPGEYTFETSRLGYSESVERVQVQVGEAVVIRLVPQPVVLEAIRILADRFETRTRATGYAARAGDRNQLISTTAPSVADFLADHFQIRPVACPRGLDPMDDCLLIRGRAVRPRLYIDDIPTPGGVFLLQSYQPRDLYRVEAIPGLYQVRIYTHEYVERLATNGRMPPPICIIC